MTTTTDLKDFGFRELRMAAALLTAYCQSPPEFLSSGVHLMMNMHSGCPAQFPWTAPFRC